MLGKLDGHNMHLIYLFQSVGENHRADLQRLNRMHCAHDGKALRTHILLGCTMPAICHRSMS